MRGYLKDVFVEIVSQTKVSMGRILSIFRIKVYWNDSYTDTLKLRNLINFFIFLFSVTTSTDLMKRLTS